MRAVAVHLDPGLGIGLAVGVAADMAPPVEEKNPQAHRLGREIGDRRAIETRAHDDEIGLGERQARGPAHPAVLPARGKERKRKEGRTGWCRTGRAPPGSGGSGRVSPVDRPRVVDRP